MAAENQLDISVTITGAAGAEELSRALARVAEAVRFGQTESDGHDQPDQPEDEVDGYDDEYRDDEDEKPEKPPAPWVYFSVIPHDKEEHIKSLVNAGAAVERAKAARMAALSLLDEAERIDGQRMVVATFGNGRMAAGFARMSDGTEAVAKRLRIDPNASDLRLFEPTGAILDT